MSYYHVLLGFQGGPQKVRCVLSDLTEKDLRTRFITPYRRGKNILCGGEVVEVSRIRTVNIVRTADGSEKELARLESESNKRNDEFNRSSTSVVLLGLGGYVLDDIGDAGQDVTSTFITDAPGHGDALTTVIALLNNGWILTVVGGLIVTALAWFFF